MKELEAQYQIKQKLNQLEQGYQQRNLPPIQGPISPQMQLGLQQIPTAQSEKESWKRLVAESLPIATDIGLTVLAPQSLGPRLGLKAPLAIDALNLAMRSLFAGAGGAIGEYGRQKILGEPTDINRIRLQAGMGAGGEILGSGMLGGAKKGTRPIINFAADATTLSKPFTRAAIRAQRETQKQIKEKTTGRMIDFIEKFYEKPKAGGFDITPLEREFGGQRRSAILPDGSIGKFEPRKPTSYSSGLRKGGERRIAPDERIILSEAIQPIPSDIAGKKVGEALKKQFDFEEVYRPWTESVDRIAAEQGGIVPVDDASQMLGELFDKFQNNRRTEQETINEISRWLGFSGSKDKPLINAIIKDIHEDGYMDPGDVKFLMSKFWKSYGKSTTAKANRWKEAFKAAFLDDLDKFGVGAAQAKKVADKTFAATHNFIRESPAAAKILGRMNFGKSDRLYFEEYPGRVSEAIFGKSDTIKNMINTKKDPEAIMKLRNAVTNTKGGEEAWTAITFNYISDLIRGSIKQAPDTGKSIIAPAELAEKIYQAQDTIRAALPVGTWNRLKNEADFLSSIAYQFEKLDVQEGYDIFTSYGILHPRGKAIIEKIGKAGGFTGKQLIKATGHLMLPQMDNNGSK